MTEPKPERPVISTCDSLSGGESLQANSLCYHGDGVHGPGLQAVQLSRGHSVL